jgi:hypothetical protein
MPLIAVQNQNKVSGTGHFFYAQKAETLAAQAFSIGTLIE